MSRHFTTIEQTSDHDLAQIYQLALGPFDSAWYQTTPRIAYGKIG